jgi:hypothetical protein
MHVTADAVQESLGAPGRSTEDGHDVSSDQGWNNDGSVLSKLVTELGVSSAR